MVAWRQAVAIYTDTTSDADQPTEEEMIEERKRSVKDRIARQLGLSENPFANQQSTQSSGDDQMREGLNLGNPGQRKLKSLLDLASCQLQLIIESDDTVLVSPFANDPTSLRRWLPLWENQTCLTQGPVTIGRINIMQASKETLATVDGISPQLAQQIVSHRPKFNPVSTSADHHVQTVGWLLEAGLVTTSQLRKISDEITMGGGVFTGVALGQLNRSHTASAIAIEIDALGPTPKIRHWQDLPPLTYRQRLRLE